MYTLDADVLLPLGYIDYLMRRAAPNRCIRTIGKESNTGKLRPWCGAGIMLVPMKAIVKVTGYDEHFDGYGEEDLDFKSRLERAGCKIIEMTSPAWTHMSHGNEERGQAQYCSRMTGGDNPNRAIRDRNDARGIVAPNGADWGMVDRFPGWSVEELK